MSKETRDHKKTDAGEIKPNMRKYLREKRRKRIKKPSLDLFSLSGGFLAVLFAILLTAAFSDPVTDDARNPADDPEFISDEDKPAFSILGLASGLSMPDFRNFRLTSGQTLLDLPGLDSDNGQRNFQDFSVATFASGDVMSDFSLYVSPAEIPPGVLADAAGPDLDMAALSDPAFAASDRLPRYAEAAPDDPEEKFNPADAGKFTPTEFSETFLFNGDAIPIYENLEPRRVELSDFVWNNNRPEYIGTDFTVKFGVDVSEHQNSDRAIFGSWDIDWEAAKADGVEFAMIRVGFRGTTSGEINEDTCYDRNITAAMKAGIQTGVYFFSQAITVEEALEEADFVLDCLRGYQIDGPVGYDWEVASRSYRNHGLDQETSTACALAFCRRIESGGYQPIIYATRETFYYDFDLGALSSYAIWYPQYPRGGASSKYPNFYYQMDVWQFSDRCKIDGIGKRVDANLWFIPK